MKRKLAKLLIAFLPLFLPALGQAQTKTLLLPFRDVNGLILLDVKVNGKPAILLFDSGANRTALSAEITDANKQEAARATHQGLFLTHQVDLELFEGHHEVFSALVVDMAQRTHMHVDGLLGEDVLRKFSAIHIDYRKHVLEFTE